MAERVLTIREANRALLARQLLLQRGTVPLTQALERVGGLQTQYAPSGYIGLWSRLLDFGRDSLTKALEQRRVVQGTLMRSTIHLVSAGDYPLFAAGLRKGRQEWWRRVTRKQFGDLDMERAAALVREHLAGKPRRATELKELLAARGFPPITWAGVNTWLDMIRLPPSGTWEQRRADLYGLAEDWLPPLRPTEAQGIEHLVRRYLSGFGPASLKDVANWTGLPSAVHLTAVQRLRLRRFRDQHGAELLDLPGAPLPDADAAAPVRFLPTWDATLLVHARRTQILPEPYRPLVFNTKTPHSVPTFLVHGVVAGTWRFENGRVQLRPFEPIPRALRPALDEEARRLAAFHGA